jgi:glycine cleavage system H lipoate-binding protein
MTPIEQDPFATKGIEYLVVIAFLAVLPFFWRYLNGTPSLAPSRVLAAQRKMLSGWFRLPETASYHPGHTWAVPAGNGRFRVGLDDFAQKLLGTAAAIALPDVGARLAQGAPAWAMDVAGRRFDLPAPVAGRIVARNEAVLRNPALVNGDPYGNGWLLEVEAPRFRSGARSLLRGDRAKAWLARTEQALRMKMNPEVGAVLQDGGVPVPGIARALSEEAWDALARELLAAR